MEKRKLDIKTVDFTALQSANDFQSAAQLIATECIETGFFLIKVPAYVEKQMSEVLNAAKMFFTLPLSKKQKLKNNKDSQFHINGESIPGTGAGYRGFAADPNFALDTRESFNIGPDVAKELVNSEQYSGCGLTTWPDDSILPGWQTLMEDYAQSMLDISTILRQLIAVALGLDHTFFEGPGYFDQPTWVLGLVHYAALQSNEEKGMFGIRPHCDSGMFTLLLGDGNPGLQVCLDKSVHYKDRVWLDIEPPESGHLIVNLGQILERWTNGRFKATLHRVLLNGACERFSVPFFYDPNVDCVIEPIVEDNAFSLKRYLPTTPGKMQLERLKKSIEDFE